MCYVNCKFLGFFEIFQKTKKIKINIHSEFSATFFQNCSQKLCFYSNISPCISSQPRTKTHEQSFAVNLKKIVKCSSKNWSIVRELGIMSRRIGYSKKPEKLTYFFTNLLTKMTRSICISSVSPIQAQWMMKTLGQIGEQHNSEKVIFPSVSSIQTQWIKLLANKISLKTWFSYQFHSSWFDFL